MPAPRDGHQHFIPLAELDVILSGTQRSKKAKRIIRKCLNKGMTYNAAAMEFEVSRQYVHEICTAILKKHHA